MFQFGISQGSRALFFHAGKAPDVGGSLSQIPGTSRPPFQRHSTQSQEVTSHFFHIFSLGKELGMLRSLEWGWIHPPEWGTGVGSFPGKSPSGMSFPASCGFIPWIFQVLPALHHLEHQGRDPGRPQHHRGEDERHLRQRVSVPLQSLPDS